MACTYCNDTGIDPNTRDWCAHCPVGGDLALQAEREGKLEQEVAQAGIPSGVPLKEATYLLIERDKSSSPA